LVVLEKRRRVMIKNQSFFKDGRKFYEVYALGKSSYIQESIVIGGIDHTKDGPFINILVIYPKVTNSYQTRGSKSFQTTDSLHDMNVIPNHYNNHKSFRTLMEARKYRNKCIRNSIGKFRHIGLKTCYDDLEETLDLLSDSDYNGD
jgi:hypothetical protein